MKSRTFFLLILSFCFISLNAARSTPEESKSDIPKYKIHFYVLSVHSTPVKSVEVDSGSCLVPDTSLWPEPFPAAIEDTMLVDGCSLRDTVYKDVKIVYVPKILFTEIDSLKNEIDSLKNEIYSLNDDVHNLRKDGIGVWFCVIFSLFLSVVAIVVLYLFIVKQKSLHKSMEDYLNQMKVEIKQLSKNDNGDLQYKYKQLEEKYKQLEDKDKQLEVKYRQLEDKLCGVKPPDNHPPKPESTLYARSISVDGELIRIHEIMGPDSIYELTLINPTKAIFTICRQAYNTILESTDYIEGCDVQVVGKKKVVEVRSNGEAIKKENGTWKVIKKISVIIK